MEKKRVWQSALRWVSRGTHGRLFERLDVSVYADEKSSRFEPRRLGHKPAIAGADVENYGAAIRRDESLKLIEIQLSHGAAANAFQHKSHYHLEHYLLQ